jgi:hypothetical protein
MLTAFYDEEVVSVGEDTLRLAIDFRAIDLIEHQCGEDGAIAPMPDVVEMLFADQPPRGLLGKVLWSLLRRHHSDISLDVAVGLMFTQHGAGLVIAIRSLIVRAMNFGDVEAKDENPPPRRGASATS